MEGWAGGQSKGTMYSEWDGDTPTATPLGKPTAKLRVVLCGERCAIMSYAALLETEPWWGQQLCWSYLAGALQDGEVAQSKSLSTSHGPGGQEARTHGLVKSRVKFP